MHFVRWTPEFQVQQGWLSVLGTIGGAVLAPFTGGLSLPIGSALGSAADTARASKKAGGQVAAQGERTAGLYAPYQQLGVQSANTLAGLLGMPGIDLSGAPPSVGTAVPRGTLVEPTPTRRINEALLLRDPESEGRRRTLAELSVPAPSRRTPSPTRPQTPSARDRSSYSGRTRE